MKKIIITTSFLYFFSISFSQVNLVPNPDFEAYDDCPVSLDGLGTSDITYISVAQWQRPSGGSSDYFNACAPDAGGYGVSVPTNIFSDYLYPHSGDGYVGFYLYLLNSSEYREYAMAKLDETLVAGACYYVEFWAASSYQEEETTGFQYTTDDIQVVFSEDKIEEYGIYGALSDYTPTIENVAGAYFTDTANWQKVSGYFIADGTETWITIGNFKTDEETDYVPIEDADPTPVFGWCYILVDDVVVSLAGATDLFTDTIVCAPVEFEIGLGAESYFWSTGDTSNSIIISEAGDYWVEVTTGCSSYIDSFMVTFVSDSLYTSSNILEFCFNASPFIIESELDYDSYSWNTGETTENISVDEEGIYILTGYSECAIFIDTFHIDIIESAIGTFDLGEDTIICVPDWELEVSVPDIFESYLWSTGEQTPSLTITESGFYIIMIETLCETIFDSIEVIDDPYLNSEITVVGDSYICPPAGLNAISLTIEPEMPNYFWSTGENTQTIIVTEAGTYTVTIALACGNNYGIKTIELCNDIYVPNAFSPNADGYNDLFCPILLNPDQILNMEIYNRWGELLFEGGNENNSWNGTINGKPAPIGNYVYHLKVRLTDASVKIMKGNITLIR